MDLVELVLTVCTLAQPIQCDERRLSFSSPSSSLRACMADAMPVIAQWSGEHPAVEVTRWRCQRAGESGEKI